MSSQRDIPKKAIPPKKYTLKVSGTEKIPINLNLVKSEMSTAKNKSSSSTGKSVTSTSRFLVSAKKDDKPLQKSSKKIKWKKLRKRRIFSSDDFKLLSIIGEGQGGSFSDILNSTSNTTHYKLMKECVWTLIFYL